MSSFENTTTSRLLLTTEHHSSKSFGDVSDRLAGVEEYSSVLQLLCPDFPVELVQSAARIVLMDDAVDYLMSFADFLYAFQLLFYYHEFLASVLTIYQDLLFGKSPNTVIVPTSIAVEQLPLLATEENTSQELQEGVEASTLAECINGLCDRFKQSYPSRTCMLDVLEQSPKVTYYGFLMGLAKHDTINTEIGALPNRSDVLVDPEMDQELLKLISQISASPGSNSSGSVPGGLRESQKKASPRRSLHHRRRMEVESDGSTEETDSSES
ncbi:centriolar satellite-associated tubulin polyglutamylase complex regulator 1 isoform X2 [Gadus chalcogrammus]|uniref:centriolar satellite-associated tubulin polyglutamylase complex regulator 1 isoform X2 n=1 Tax=Gadus chalcogrammus TaxID=1042646 RepID=UPI0024C4D314|nr:centriolar satellite-associated tubulin polyglutamylase complex regulator 1 isoform X2 [Gadus chalcogrammus]